MKKIAYASSRPIARGEPNPYNFFFPPGKCVGHSLKELDIV